jgi:hypothetical protein
MPRKKSSLVHNLGPLFSGCDACECQEIERLSLSLNNKGQGDKALYQALQCPSISWRLKIVRITRLESDIYLQFQWDELQIKKIIGETRFLGGYCPKAQFRWFCAERKKTAQIGGVGLYTAFPGNPCLERVVTTGIVRPRVSQRVRLESNLVRL